MSSGEHPGIDDHDNSDRGREFRVLGGARKRVFLSHASVDHELVENLCSELERQGIGCWVAPRDIAPGRSWAHCILEALETCPFFVLFLTESANRSEQVVSEVERARDKGATVITLKAVGVVPNPALEYLLSRDQWIEASVPPSLQDIKELAIAVGEHELMEVSYKPTLRSADPSEHQHARHAKLVVQLKDAHQSLTGKTHKELANGEKLIIGRAMDADVRVSDGEASRHHACLSVNQLGGRLALSVVDMQSSNGTAVNGNKIIEPVILHCGDVIHIGALRIEVVIG